MVVDDAAPVRAVLLRGQRAEFGGDRVGEAHLGGLERAGLLAVSAAVAVGAVAVASGLLPGGDHYSISGGGAAGQVHA
ncbi:hypothetical protein ACM9HB_34560, partial [Streptomyces sp. JAC128]